MFENKMILSFNLLAAGISFYINKSILWALIHGFLGWGYIGYLSMKILDNKFDILPLLSS